LAERNPGVEVDFRRVDTNQFTATKYNDGGKAAWRLIFTGYGAMGNGIAFSVLTSLVFRSQALNRCRYRGDDGMQRWVSLGVIAGKGINVGLTLGKQSPNSYCPQRKLRVAAWR
jgi:hypothetical protein